MYALIKGGVCVAINKTGFTNAVLDDDDLVIEHDNPIINYSYDSDSDSFSEIETTYTNDEIIALRAAAYADNTTGSDRLFVEYQALLAQDLTDEAEEAKTAWLARRTEIKEEYPLSTDEEVEEVEEMEEVETTEDTETDTEEADTETNDSE